MTETISSIIDQPITLSGQERLDDKDRFGISRYERALTEFIRRADTPLTIALQGEWGSGKTSLMNLLKYHLCEADDALYYPVWINTWQHSIMSDAEYAIVGILQSIIWQLGHALNETTEDKETSIRPIINQAVRIAGIGAANIVGRMLFGVANAGSDIKAAVDSSKEEQLKELQTGDSKIAELRKSIAELLDRILFPAERKASQSGRKGFLFFIDDLDRIDPPVAVQILELLKNIFDLEHCIYVLAIDYDVVVKGLKPKFGELTDKNAREFRSFFDKIIQLPFAMPVGSYRIDEFLIDALGRIGYLTPAEQGNEELKLNLTQMAMYSVGTNPRSLKRLTNILSLIQLMTESDKNQGNGQQVSEGLVDKQINFALVCLQIVYPLVYNTLLEYPNFRQWGAMDEDSNGDGKTLARKLSLQELTEAEQRKLDKQGEDFDEVWERTLFRVCLKDNYLSSRVVDISRLLNMISSLVPMSENEDAATAAREHNEAVAETVERLIRFSAVTNVHTSEETVTKKIEDFNPSWWLKQFRDRFVPAFNSRMGGQDTLKCTNGRVQNRLHFIFVKQERARTDGHYSVVTMGHDDSSYTLTWKNDIAFLHGGFGTIEEEQQLLGCPGLHESIVREMREYASQYPEFNLNLTDSYERMNQAGQKHGAFQMIAKYARNQLEELVADEAIQRFADFLSGLMRIRFKAIPEIHAFCHGHDDILRKQLEKIDIAPFSNRRQWISQTYLDGLKIGNDSFGLSLHLCSDGFRAILWEAHENSQKLNAMLDAHPELGGLFPELHENGPNRKHPEIIPFDTVIDWLKNLQSILIRAQ